MSFNFGSDSLVLKVIDLVQEKRLSSQEYPQPAWNLFLSQRQDFPDNNLVQNLISINQEGTFEMKEVVFDSAGAQDMDTSGYELSDLVNIAFVWKNPQIELDAVSRPGMSTPFSPTAFNDFEKGERGSLKNPIAVDEEEDKEKTVLQKLLCLSFSLNLPRCSKVIL